MKRIGYALVVLLFILSLLSIILIDDPYYFRHAYLFIAGILSYSVSRYSERENIIPTIILSIYLNIYCLFGIMIYQFAKISLFNAKYWFIQFVLPSMITVFIKSIMKKMIPKKLKGH